jgi:hypothetical protein
MLFDPEEAAVKLNMPLPPVKVAESVVTPAGELIVNRHHYHRGFKGNLRLFERWMRFKQFVMLKSFRKKDDSAGDASEKKRSILSLFFW